MPVHHSAYPQQWWPYLYEVITQQWYCLLLALTQKPSSISHDAILEEESEEESDSDENDTDAYSQNQYAFTRENIPAIGTVPPGSSPDEMTRLVVLSSHIKTLYNILCDNFT